jgi:hypothetical protein
LIRSANIITAVRYFHRLHGAAPGWSGALLVALVAAAGPSEAVTLQPGSILITSFEGGGGTSSKGIVRLGPPGGDPPVSLGQNLGNPIGIAIAANGDLFVADPNCCGDPRGPGGVIRVNPAKPADANQTVVSSGGHFGQPTGIAIAGNGDLLVVDQVCCGGTGGKGGVIRVNPADGTQTVVARAGFFRQPTGIAIATNGDLLVVDGKCCGGKGGVIRVDPAKPATDNQTVVASGGFFDLPTGIAIATNGDLVVADFSCCGGQGGVIRVDPAKPATDNQTVVASGGYFHSPLGIGIGVIGELFVVDALCCGGDGGVIRVDPAKPVTDNQTPVSAGFVPQGIAIVGLPRRTSPAPGFCGGSVPCACGDHVVRDRTLRGVDPVTRTVCPADGLVVAGGVTLGLGGATLRGQGAGAGVRIEAGATHVTVQSGKVTGFATGVRGEHTTGVHLANLSIFDSGQDGVNLTGDGHTVEITVIQGNGGIGVAVVGHASRLSRLQVKGNARAGVRLVGSGHTLEQSLSEGNGEHGAEVSGDDNQVALLQAEGNGGDGVHLKGTGNTAARNTATRNGGDGLEIAGAGATLDRNRATSNGEAGLEIHGTGHTVTQNIVGQNAGTGLEMLGTTGSRFERNRGENNGGFGVRDDSTGTGTSGTANTYTQNICGRGNAAGVSSPARLCR